MKKRTEGVVKAPPSYKGGHAPNSRGLTQLVGQAMARMKTGQAYRLPGNSAQSRFASGISLVRAYSGRAFRTYRAADGDFYVTVDP